MSISDNVEYFKGSCYKCYKDGSLTINNDTENSLVCVCKKCYFNDSHYEYPLVEITNNLHL